jgi:hypothetical protein
VSAPTALSVPDPGPPARSPQCSAKTRNAGLNTISARPWRSTAAARLSITIAAGTPPDSRNARSNTPNIAACDSLTVNSR